MAASIPSPATASVRAMTIKSGSVRPATAARTRSTISSRAHQLFVGPVPAAFHIHLIFDLQGRRPGRDHRARGLRRIIPSRIHIHQHWQRRGRANPPHILRHLLARGEPQIRQTKRRLATPEPET
jgi:hypothetical protein